MPFFDIGNGSRFRFFAADAPLFVAELRRVAGARLLLVAPNAALALRRRGGESKWEISKREILL